MTAPAKFDARAAWAALDDEQRRAIGEAALLLQVSSETNCSLPDSDGPYDALARRWEHAETAAWQLLGEAVSSEARDYPDGPDLAALGIRACRNCGCTTESGCAGGCWWVGADLCSSCGEKVPDR